MCLQLVSDCAICCNLGSIDVENGGKHAGRKYFEFALQGLAMQVDILRVGRVHAFIKVQLALRCVEFGAWIVRIVEPCRAVSGGCIGDERSEVLEIFNGQWFLRARNVEGAPSCAVVLGVFLHVVQ